MTEHEELFKKILDQPDPVALSRLTPYCSDFTLDAFAKYCKRFKHTRTANEYAYIFADFFNFLQKDFLQLSAEDVYHYFSSVKDRYSVSSLCTRISSLRAFARYLDKTEDPDDPDSDTEPCIPCEDFLPSPQTIPFSELFPEFSFEREQPIVVGVTMREIDQVLSRLLDEQNLTLFAIISLVLRTALTTEEICELTIHQLICTNEPDKCGIVIPGIRNRFVKVPVDLFSLLLMLSEQSHNESGTLFLTGRNHCPFTQRNLLQEIKKACNRAGVRPFTLQQLRNYAILIMLRSKAPEQLVSDYVATDLRWITKYKEAAADLKAAPCDYVSLSFHYHDIGGIGT